MGGVGRTRWVIVRAGVCKIDPQAAAALMNVKTVKAGIVFWKSLNICLDQNTAASLIEFDLTGQSGSERSAAHAGNGLQAGRTWIHNTTSVQYMPAEKWRADPGIVRYRYY